MRRCGVDLDCYFKAPCLKIERMISGAAKLDSGDSPIWSLDFAKLLFVHFTCAWRLRWTITEPTEARSAKDWFAERQSKYAHPHYRITVL